MRREPGWNDTLLVAEPTDPPDSGIRNPHSSQRCLLVPASQRRLSLERTRRTCSRAGHTSTQLFRFHENMSFIGSNNPSPE